MSSAMDQVQWIKVVLDAESMDAMSRLLRHFVMVDVTKAYYLVLLMSLR